MAAETPAAPSGGQIARATALAVAGATVILGTIVLPAEFGLDPLGTGRALGLYRPRAVESEGTAASDDLTAAAGAEASGAGASGLLLAREQPARTDEMSITLAPGEGTEIKAAMRDGDVMVFSWTATGGGVDVDMHGDFTGARKGESTSYRQGEFQKGGHGVFRAPAAGNHGWFWQNLTDDPVTVTVKTSGFYEKLFQP